MQSSKSLDKKYTMMRIYPGVELREQLEALQRILRREESSLSEVLRPALEQLVEKYRSEIQIELRKSKKKL